MKLQVGKYYKDRRDRIRGPIEQSPHDGRYPFYVDAMTFTAEGQRYTDEQHITDLIEEVFGMGGPRGIDPLTGAPRCENVPLTTPKQVFRVGDMVVPIAGITYPAGWVFHKACIGKVARIKTIYDAPQWLACPDAVITLEDMGLVFCAEWLRHASVAEIAIEAPPKRITRRVWAVSSRHGGGWYPNREAAEKNAEICSDVNAIFCLDIDIPEGLGLDGFDFVAEVRK